jgi:hypothetical protein
MLRLEAWERRIMEEILQQRSGGVPTRLANLFGRGTYEKLEKMKQQGFVEWSIQEGYTVTPLGKRMLAVGQKVLEYA